MLPRIISAFCSNFALYVIFCIVIFLHFLVFSYESYIRQGSNRLRPVREVIGKICSCRSLWPYFTIHLYIFQQDCAIFAHVDVNSSISIMIQTPIFLQFWLFIYLHFGVTLILTTHLSKLTTQTSNLTTFMNTTAILSKIRMRNSSMSTYLSQPTSWTTRWTYRKPKRNRTSETNNRTSCNR